MTCQSVAGTYYKIRFYNKDTGLLRFDYTSADTVMGAYISMKRFLVTSNQHTKTKFLERREGLANGLWKTASKEAGYI